MSDTELVRLLAADKGANQRQLDEWLRKTSPNAAADQLARVIDKCRPAPPRRTQTLQTFLMILVCVIVLLAVLKIAFGIRASSTPVLFCYFPFFALLSQHGHVGRRASLLLAQLNDQRAIAGLAASWSPSVKKDSETAENERIESEITRLTTMYTGMQTGPYATTSAALRKMLHRAAQSWRRDVRRGIRLDIPDSRADMLLAAVRFIGHNGMPEDIAVLNQIATLPLPNTVPANRDAVREAAAYLVSENAAVMSPAVPVVSASIQQTIGRQP
jgi:hypothetical protein